MSKKEFLSVDSNAAAYWNGPVSRTEFQKVADEITGAIKMLAVDCAKLDIALTFLMVKGGWKPDDINAWQTEKMAEFQALQAASKKLVS